MLDFRPLLVLGALNLAAAMSPGPAFVLVTHTAASSKRKVALATAAGTAAAALTWATAALLGLQFILASAAGIYRILQFAGGLYLCVIGWATFRRAPLPLPESNDAGLTVGEGFRKGLFLGLSNPKVIVFFGTIFTAVLTPATPAAVRWASLGVILVNETVWYGTLATVFGTAPVRKMYRRVKIHSERFFGGLLMLVGARLAWSGARGS